MTYLFLWNVLDFLDFKGEYMSKTFEKISLSFYTLFEQYISPFIDLLDNKEVFTQNPEWYILMICVWKVDLKIATNIWQTLKSVLLTVFFENFVAFSIILRSVGGFIKFVKP